MSGRISIPVLRQPGAAKTTHVDIQRQTQSAGAQAAAVLNAQPRQNPVTIYNQRFVVGTNTIVIHGLGRTPKGYALVNKRADPTQAAATAAQDAQRNVQDDTNTLSLGPFQPFLADVEVWL